MAVFRIDFSQEQAMHDVRTETTLQVRKIGDSIGLILSNELLSRLNLKEGDTLYSVAQPDGSIWLTPHKPKHARAMEIARKIMHEYRDTFKALAK
jgi:putative addiction module antidote